MVSERARRRGEGYTAAWKKRAGVGKGEYE